MEKNPKTLPFKEQLLSALKTQSLTELNFLEKSEEIQCIAGINVPFGKAQCPTLNEYADGIDTMQFLLTL